MEKFFHSELIEQKNNLVLKRNIQVFFFSIEGSNVVSFLVEFSDDFACIWSVNCFFFFNTIIRASKSSLSQKETLVVIGHLLSLVTRKKKQLGNEAKSFFFPSIHSSSRVFFVCLAGSIYFVFFLFFLLFFCVFLSNVKFV